MATQLVSARQLRDALNQFFDEAELRNLCFDLGIEYESLGGDSKRARVLELVQYCERHGRTDDLINYIQRARPNIDWNDLQATNQGPARKEAQRPYQQTNLPEDSVVPDFELLTKHSTQTPDTDNGRTDDTTPETPNPFQTLAAHNGTLLVERQGVRVYGLVTQKPWNLPVDAFVLPLESGSIYYPGELARALEADLSRANADSPREGFEKTVASRSPASLMPESPFLLMRNNSDYWTLPTTERKVIVATAYDGQNYSTANATKAARAIIQLAIDNDLQRITLPPLEAGAGPLLEREVALTMLDTILATLSVPAPDGRSLDEIILTTINSEVLAAMRQRFVKRPQPTRNDEPIGRDLLQVETAVYALAEMCLLHDMDPPLAVGILGGWGSGKSFVMHLMQERIAQLRGRRQTSHSPYVGHIYQIKFDAWTYAKSNLWASLMQTIFYELNAQLTRERELWQKLVELKREALTAEMADAATLLEAETTAPNQVWQEAGSLWQVLAYPNIRGPQARDVINFAAELDKSLRSIPPEEIAEKARDFIRGQRSNRGAQASEPEDLLWAELRKLKEAELQELRRTEKELADKQAALEQARVALRKQVDEEIAREAKEAAWKPLQNAFKQQFGAATAAIEKMFTAVEPTATPTIRQTLSNTAAVGQMIRNNPTEFAAFLLLTLFLAVALYVSENVTLQLPGTVLAVGSLLMAFIRSYDKWLTLIRQSFVAYQLQVEAERNRLADGREERIQQKLAEQTKAFNQAREVNSKVSTSEDELPNIPDLEEEIATLEAKARRQRQRVGITASYVSLLDFVSSRLDEAIYEKELGLMHQVQRDLKELCESLASNEHDLFPRGRARVILYIDDLDRCPPNRVVEVLEAVQLLLKTDLFVVVLAVDVRFITRALETVYKGILTRRGSPSGLDYIEKIVQIPYQVQPIEDEAVSRYLEKQMAIAAEEGEGETEDALDEGAVDGGTAVPNQQVVADVADTEAKEAENDGRAAEPDLPIEAIEIGRAEYQAMEKCCKQVAISPRAIKRLANVYKLLKIIWYREGSEPADPQMMEVVMALLALSERYPNQMRDLFESLARQIRAKAETTLADFAQTQLPTEEQDRYTAQEWQQFVADTAVLSPTIPLRQIDLRTFNLVRSFCFVGDIGYDPGDKESKQ
jgi:hypothetical protein